jgi:hypothetical protein
MFQASGFGQLFCDSLNGALGERCCFRDGFLRHSWIFPPYLQQQLLQILVEENMQSAAEAPEGCIQFCPAATVARSGRPLDPIPAAICSSVPFDFTINHEKRFGFYTFSKISHEIASFPL